MIINRLLLLFAVLAPLATWAQQQVIRQKISWKTDTFLANDDYLYGFNGLFLENDSTPYYIAQLPLDAPLGSKPNILVELKDLESKAVHNQGKQPTTFKVNGQAQYSYSVVHIRKQPYVQIKLLPYLLQQGRLHKIRAFGASVRISAQKRTATAQAYAQESVLANGQWYKFKVTQEGVYKIGYDQLRSMGISNPQAVRLFGTAGQMVPNKNSENIYDDLPQVAIRHENDAIVFYAKGPVNWNVYYSTWTGQAFLQQQHLYDNAAWYFLSADYINGTAQTIGAQSSSTQMATKTITQYVARDFHEENDINLLHSGDTWFGNSYHYNTEQDFNFNFDNLLDSGAIISSFAARAFYGATNININVGKSSLTTSFPTVESDYTTTHAILRTTAAKFVTDGNPISVKTTYNKVAVDDNAWVNYITVNANCRLAYTAGKALFFRSLKSVADNAVSEFIIADAPAELEVLDVTDPIKPVKMLGNYASGKFSFRCTTNKLREFVAFTPSNYKQADLSTAQEVANQNLHAQEPFDLVIVCPSIFWAQANELAQMRKAEGLRVNVVTPQQVYNEFSSGMQDPGAIRNYMKMLYDRAGTATANMPKYLLLFGDGSYDNLGPVSKNDYFIPTYQSPESLIPTSTFVTDDFYGLLDSDEGGSTGFIDIGIGRIPASTIEQAQTAINKIKHYQSAQSYGDWKNTITFIADDADASYDKVHIQQADILADTVKANKPQTNISKIYMDNYKQEQTSVGERYPEAKQAVSDQVARGSLIINYTGHGGIKGFSHERLVTMDDIDSWANMDRLAIFMTATCEFTRFDDTNENGGSQITAPGEALFFNPKGGAICLFSTSRIVFISPNFDLNLSFYQHLFNKDANGNNLRMGDVMRLTKNDNYSTNKRNFTLLGDPSLSVPFPQYQVSTTSLNHKPVVVGSTNMVDTLTALSYVEGEGVVLDANGAVASSFNGTVYPVIYDKETAVVSLGNEWHNDVPWTWTTQMRNNILYRGKSSIKNGMFKFRFIVPRDISYQYGQGRLSYYAFSNEQEIDGNGVFEQFIIGGSSSSAVSDAKGPELNLYMNDTTFTFGGVTNDAPTFLALIQDSSGINTVGNGIGHDLTLTIDNDPKQVYVLNDFYESNLDDYQQGKAEYPLSALPVGEHLATLKAWDVNNNSATKELEFIVAKAEGLQIEHLLNYPNPFTTHTEFYFQHNQAATELEVCIQIFTVSGKLVKTIESTIIPTGFTTEAAEGGSLAWDGLDDFGDRIGRGVYVYRVKLRNVETGQQTEKYNKLLILR